MAVDRHRRGPAAGAALLAALLAAASLTAAGCGRTDRQAQDLIRESNRHLAKAADEIKGLAGFDARWREVVSSKAGSEAALSVKGMLENARGREEKALAEVKAAMEAIAGIKGLDAGEDLKTWAGMKLAALEEQQGFLEIELEAMDLRLQAMDDLLEGAILKDTLMAEKRIDVLEKESRERARKAYDLHKKANAYFKERKLGR